MKKLLSSAMKKRARTIRIGADIGGTFTDVVLIDTDGAVHRHKLLSTPPDFESAVLSGIEHILASGENIAACEVTEVAHGTTVATNAVLERQGALTALITTKGCKDVLELRRVRAPKLYDLFFEKTPSLVPRNLCYEIDERVLADGTVLRSIDEAELHSIKNALEKEGVESVGVCLLHSYAYPQHEIIIGDFLRTHLPQVQVSLSCEVLRELREYERTATTVVNAYVSPIMRVYLGALRSGLDRQKLAAPLLIMQSAGGLTTDKDAARRPVYVLESGPAAGVLAAKAAADRVGIKNIISLDMGGTTAKAAMVEDGRLSYCPEYEVGTSLSTLANRLVGGAGDLIRAATLDIAEVGAGGGSIAYLDNAGGLHVGPRSAGARPGPVCYQRGGRNPTVTDANVVLGFIRAGELADGSVLIDPQAAEKSIVEQIATPMGMDVIEAAEGIHRIANARMMRALRAVSSERGRDPRDFALVGFGGSGPIHAAGLSAELGCTMVLIPPLPGLFSAVGLLSSGIVHHEVRSCMLSGDGLAAEALNRLREEMRSKLVDQFTAEGYETARVEFLTGLDVRFKGQSSEIHIPLDNTERIDENTIGRLADLFGDEHERLYGHRSEPGNPIEVMAVRLIGRASIEEDIGGFKTVTTSDAKFPDRKAYFGKEFGVLDTAVVTRKQLRGETDGPLLIDEYDSTIVIPPGVRARLDEHENVVITPKDTSRDARRTET